MGLHLDLPLDAHRSSRKRVVSDLADAIAAIAED
jgi:hypothetical protein